MKKRTFYFKLTKCYINQLKNFKSPNVQKSGFTPLNLFDIYYDNGSYIYVMTGHYNKVNVFIAKMLAAFLDLGITETVNSVAGLSPNATPIHINDEKIEQKFI
jgi:hypothetical protein